VANHSGYMVNETYPFFIKLHYDNGYVSKWRDVGNRTFNGGGTYASIANGRLTSNTPGTYKVYSYGATVSGINISSIRGRVNKIEIGRGVCNPTVLATGQFIPSHSTNAAANLGGSFNVGVYTGNSNGDSVGYGTYINNSNDLRYFGVMVSPDWLTSDSKPDFQPGDYLIVYGSMAVTSKKFNYPGTSFGGYVEFNGYSNKAGDPVAINIVDAVYAPYNTQTRILKNDALSLYQSANLVKGSLSEATMSTECMAMTLDARILSGATDDRGVYYVQYVRPNSNQYTIKDVDVVSTGTFIDIDSSSPDTLPITTVFGGDTYTQKTYVKMMYDTANVIYNGSAWVAGANGGKLSSFIGAYSQNKINQQLRFVDKTFKNQPFPFGNTLDNYLFGEYDAMEQFQIDKGYDWYAPINAEKPYNSKLPIPSKLISRIYYSLQKPLGAIEDFYRTILPNNFKDLAAKDGPIVGLYDTNDVMVAIQQYGVFTLPYQSDVALSQSDGSVYIGNGGVYAQRENKVSSYGASLKSATLKAENEAGNSQVYWYSDSSKALMRYGSDGIKSLSDINGYRTFFLNSSAFIKDEFDIVMGYDRTRRIIMVTARALNATINPWVSGATYTYNANSPTYVSYGATNAYHTFEQLPDVYRLKQTTSSNQSPWANTADWEYMPITDMSLYNYWTVVYNEKANWFSGSFSLLPERYFIFDGRMQVPRGISPRNYVYDLFGGTGYLQWLAYNGTYKQGSFEFEFVPNKQGLSPERFKWIGLQVGMDHDTATNPTVTVSTETQTVTMDASEWEYRNGQLGVGIFPDSNEDPIIGEYAKIRLVSDVYYRCFAMVTHLYTKARTILK